VTVLQTLGQIPLMFSGVLLIVLTVGLVWFVASRRRRPGA
jgi:hypothetical protein